MTSTVRGICRFAVYFSVFGPLCRFTLVYEGHFVFVGKYDTCDKNLPTSPGHYQNWIYDFLCSDWLTQNQNIA